MSRIHIARGILHTYYEPHDLPGAMIPVWRTVIDPTGATPPERIAWDGPGTWIESRDGVPDGYWALWLGAPDATRPHVVYVSEVPTPDSDTFDAAYRAAWSGKRRPSITATMSPLVVEARQQAWRDKCAAAKVTT